MNFFQEYLLSVLIFGGYLLLLCSLFFLAAFRKFKSSPHQPPSLFLAMAACSVPGLVTGYGLVILYWICYEKGWFSALYSSLPGGWEDIHLVAITVGGSWAGILMGALAGGWLWRRRTRAQP